MKDVIFTITANTRKVAKTKDFLGINGENLQDNIIVDFSDEFIDGYAYLEVDFGTSKGFIGMTKVEQHYVLPIQSSLLAVAGNIYCQVRIDAPVDANTMSVFKSEKFEIPVLEAINAEGTVPEEYPTWVENADLKLAEVDTALANMQSATSKPNLLINSNFAINQRGENSYTGSSYKYTVDRFIKRESSDTVAILTGGGIRFTRGSSGSSPWFSQALDPSINNMLLGKTLTLSAKVKGFYAQSSVTRVRLTVGNGNNAYASGGLNFGHVDINGTGIFSATINIPQTLNNSYINVILMMLNSNSGDYYELEWLKLEIGSVATAYNPPLIAEELPKCQRYYLAYRTLICSAYNVNTTSARFCINTPVEMRTTPTISFSSGYGYIISGGSSNANTAVNIYVLKSNSIIVSTSNSGLTSNNASTFTTGTNVDMTLDAEIY